MTTIRRSAALVAGPVLALLVASSVAADPGGDRHAKGTFVDANGNTIGHVHVTQDRNGVRINVVVATGGGEGRATGCDRVDVDAVQPGRETSTASTTRTGRTSATCRTSSSTPTATAASMPRPTE